MFISLLSIDKDVRCADLNEENCNHSLGTQLELGTVGWAVFESSAMFKAFLRKLAGWCAVFASMRSIADLRYAAF